MSDLFDIDGIAARLCAEAGITGFLTEAATLLSEVFHRSEIARGDAQAITGRERAARTVLAALLKDDILASNSEKGAVFLRLPVEKRDLLFPQFFERM